MGWTPLGLVEHLGHAERFWFQIVCVGTAAPLTRPADLAGDHDAPFTTTRRELIDGRAWDPDSAVELCPVPPGRGRLVG